MDTTKSERENKREREKEREREGKEVNKVPSSKVHPSMPFLDCKR
jgi:hypothetical protein